MIGGKLKYSSTEKFKPLEGRVKASTNSMALKMFVGKIVVSKITKEKIFKGEKNATLDCVIYVDEESPDKYGYQLQIVESLSQQERQSGKKANYIGNFKMLEKKANDNTEVPKEDIDLPF